MSHDQQRLDAEWLATNAFRDVIGLATEGDSNKATYAQAIALGGQVIPGLLGEDSLLKRAHEGDLTREYRQKAQAKGLLSGTQVSPLALVNADIGEYERLVKTSRNRKETDELNRKLGKMRVAQKELDATKHSEHELIFQDANNVSRQLPEIGAGQGFRDYKLSANSFLRVRVFHPDRPEHISGADILYERHDKYQDAASIVAVQYKIWEEKCSYLNDERMQRQLGRMHQFFCDQALCRPGDTDHTFRFPYCSAYLRPADKLQTPDQRLASTGEHLPICQLANVQSEGPRGATVLTYDNIRAMSLGHGVFQGLFTTGKIGSRLLPYAELSQIYRRLEVADDTRLLIHAQDFDQPIEQGSLIDDL
jgi:hypothetical protein